MKFAIVLLALVACAAAIPQQRGIIEDVQNKVTEAIDKAKADLASLGNLADALIANAQTQVASVIAGAKNQIAAQINNIENTIAGMISKGGAVAVCAQANLAPLTEFKNNFGKNVEGCTAGLSTTLGGFQNSVLSELASLSASVAQLVSLAQECSSSIIDAALCAVTKFDEVQSLISTIVTQAGDAIDDTRAKVTASVSQIQTCAQQTIGEATISINKFVIAVQQCA